MVLNGAQVPPEMDPQRKFQPKAPQIYKFRFDRYTEEDELPEFDLESTEVRELQILRDHTDYLTCIKVFGNTIYSSCSDGEVSY